MGVPWAVRGRRPAPARARGPGAATATGPGERGFFVWHGHYYAIAVMERLGTLDRGGLVRVGFVHYNTIEEIDRLLAALRQLAG